MQRLLSNSSTLQHVHYTEATAGATALRPLHPLCVLSLDKEGVREIPGTTIWLARPGGYLQRLVCWSMTLKSSCDRSDCCSQHL